MLKYCEICGKPFNAATTAKYCSSLCRQIATRKNHKEWVERTGYNEKRRNESREYNELQLKKAEKNAKEDEKNAKEDEKREERNRKRREAYRRKKEVERLGTAATSGDALAQMKAARKYSYEYWEAYQDYIRGFAISHGLETSQTVNGISVHDEDFPLKVMITIEELGVIHIDRG